MKHLVFETSAHTVSVAVVTPEGILGELTMNTGHTHSEKLMPAMETLFGQLGLRLTDLDGIVVTSGPGSFTGIRIGMATAKGLLVVEIEDGSVAGESGVDVGDVILEANGRPVDSVKALTDVVNGDGKAKGAVMLLMQRQGRNLFRTIPVQ